VLSRCGIGRERMLSGCGASGIRFHWCRWVGGNSDVGNKCHSGTWTVLEAVRVTAMGWWHCDSLVVDKLPVEVPSIVPVAIVLRDMEGNWDFQMGLE
jgi:hypothetical protein